jgi:hypothetical protein
MTLDEWNEKMEVIKDDIDKSANMERVKGENYDETIL